MFNKKIKDLNMDDISSIYGMLSIYDSCDKSAIKTINAFSQSVKMDYDGIIGDLIDSLEYLDYGIKNREKIEHDIKKRMDS